MGYPALLGIFIVSCVSLFLCLSISLYLCLSQTFADLCRAHKHRQNYVGRWLNLAHLVLQKLDIPGWQCHTNAMVPNFGPSTNKDFHPREPPKKYEIGLGHSITNSYILNVSYCHWMTIPGYSFWLSRMVVYCTR